MKKLFGLFAAPLVAVSMLCSCGGANVKVENDIDSLNYAFGYANGNGIRQYVIGDTMPKTEIDKFKDGFKETFKNLDAAKRLKYEGMRFATSFGIDVNNGFLLRDSAFVLNKDLMMSYFDKGLRNQVIEFSSSQAEGFVQKIMFANMEGTAPTPEQIDTVNMAYGFVNGRGVRTYMLKGDTTAADVNSFMKGLNEGLEMDMESNKIFLEGTRIGLALYDQLTNAPGLLNDADIPVNIDLIKKALMFGLDNDSTVLMTMDEADQYIQTYMDNKKKAAAQKALEEKKITYKQNIEDGEAFLAENATKEGVSVTESGLQYKVEKMGKGAKPTATDKVKVHYHGTLIDGTVFDSSVERGESIEFPLNGVIAGWTEGLQLMPVGSKFTFYIPYDLAYGDRNTGSIPPFSTLIFDVELIDIVK